LTAGNDKSGPDFLGVGPERTGTSWLYTNLGAHPGIWLPPIKELRYFYEAMAYPGESVAGRFGRRDWHTEQYRRYLARRFGFYSRNPGRIWPARKRMFWDLRYLFGSRSTGWYRHLFPDTPGRISGDISPQYFFLPEARVEKIAHDFPALGIIVTLRDPVAWIWSFVRMVYRSRDLQCEARRSELEEFVRQKLEHCRFSDTLERWQRHFSHDRVHVLFFDRIAEEPSKALAELCGFLGVDASRLGTGRSPDPGKVVNSGRAAEMPQWLARLAAEGWYRDIQKLAARHDGYPARWLASMDEILER